MEKQFCARCGTEQLPPDKFCRKCGAPLKGAKIELSSRPKPAKTSRGISTTLALLAVGGILLLLIGGVILNNTGQLAHNATQNIAEPVDSHGAQGVPYPEVPRISLEDAKAKFEGKTALFVDVRTEGEFDAWHIPDAKLFSLADLSVRYQELPRDREVLTYCT